MRHNFTQIEACSGWPVSIEINDHDITLTDTAHAEDNSITLTNVEFELIARWFQDVLAIRGVNIGGIKVGHNPAGHCPYPKHTPYPCTGD